MGNDSNHPGVCKHIFNFNPRSRVGNDLSEIVIRSYSGFISIHVPAWGTTVKRSLDEIIDTLFQSTFPRGERLNYRVQCRSHFYFNPRSRVGNDKIGDTLWWISDISIHVPAWGTTNRNRCDIIRCRISIHVPAWGTTLGQCFIERQHVISIHVPAWGTTDRC